MKRERNVFLNCLKGIACFFVVLIHVPLPDSNVSANIAGFAVPLFFMISGYYSLNAGIGKISQRLRHISRILVAGVLSYVLLTIMKLLLAGRTVDTYISAIFNLRTIFQLVVFQDFDAFNCLHLWFLLALIDAYLIHRFVLQHTNRWSFDFLTVVMLMARIVVCDVTRTYDSSWHLRSNVYFYGMPYFLLGLTIANNEDIIKEKLSNKVIATITGICMLLTAILTAIGIKYYELWTIAFSAGIFLLAVKNPKKSFSKVLERIGEKYSIYIYIYIYHLAARDILEYLLRRLGMNTYSTAFQWYFPFLVMLGSLIASVFIYHFVDGLKRLCFKNSL